MKEVIDWPRRHNNLWCLLIVLITIFGAGCALFQDKYSNIILLVFASCSATVLFVMTKISPRNGRWLGPLQILSAWLTYPIFSVIHDSQPRSLDTVLSKLDQWLWPSKSLAEHLFSWSSTGFSELMAIFYISFHLLVAISIIYYIIKGDNAEALSFFHGLMMVYFASFLIYIMLPAAGPYSEQQALFVLSGNNSYITNLVIIFLNSSNTGMTAFPSLPTGISLYILGHFLLSHRYKISFLLLPIAIGIPTSILYLFHHYGISVLIGSIIAVAVLFYSYRIKGSFYV